MVPKNTCGPHEQNCWLYGGELAAARIKSPKACQQAGAAKRCINRCTQVKGHRRSKIKCLQKCARKMPKTLRKPYSACLKKAKLESANGQQTTFDGQLQCLESIDLESLDKIATCRRPLALDGRILKQLQRKFKRLGIRRTLLYLTPS